MNRRAFLFVSLIVLCVLLFAGVGWRGLAAPLGQEGTPVEEIIPARLASVIDGRPVPVLDGAAQPQTQAPTLPNSVSMPWSKLVFNSYRDDNYEIYIADGTSSNETRLTSNSASDMTPRLSHNCQKIAFASDRTGNFEIFTMNLDGSGVMQLTSNVSTDSFPAWSPDGTRIAFQTNRDGQYEIYGMNADGSNQTRLTSSGDYDGQPAWSPDGSKIAFVSRRTGGYRIYVMNSDGSGVTPLSTQAYSFHPVWAPDGSLIAYDADGNNNEFQELWLMNADGSNQHLVYQPEEVHVDAWGGTWSPNGQYIGFTKITWVLYQGAWYWSDARAMAVHLPSMQIYNATTRWLDWYPDWQTTDGDAPVTTMQPLPSQSPAPFLVSWSGYDIGPSGIWNYDVQVRDGSGGTWNNWKMEWNATPTDFYGIGGHTYYFRARSRDYAGNVEAWPADYDTWTQVEAYPPRTSILPLPAYSQGDILVEWQGIDPGGSGIASYDIQYSDLVNGVWTDWVTGTLTTSATFSGVPGHTYAFRSRASDRASNIEAWSTLADATTTIYAWAHTGFVKDNRDIPIVGATVTVQPGLMNPVVTLTNGDYTAYVSESAGPFTMTWAKSEYADLPSLISKNAVPQSLTVLPPKDNILLDWGFEGDDGEGWLAGGIYTPSITSTVKHTGERSGFLGSYDHSFAPISQVSPSAEQARPQLTVDLNGYVHVVWADQSNIRYSYQDLTGLWSDPISLGSTAYYIQGVRIASDKYGNIHVAWIADEGLFYVERHPDGVWTDIVKVGSVYSTVSLKMAVDSRGGLHLVYRGASQGYDALWYSYRDSAGNWFSSKLGGIGIPYLVVDPQDIVHVAWEEYNNLVYAQKALDGVWSFDNPPKVPDSTGPAYPKIAIDGNVVHMVWYENGVAAYYYSNRDGDGIWSTPINIEDEAGWALYDYSPLPVVDRAGNLHLVMWASGNIRYLERLTDGTWTEVYSLSESGFGETPDMSIDTYNNLKVVWKDDDITGLAEIYYAQRDQDGAWSPKMILSSTTGPDSRSITPMLAVNDIGQPYAVWEDQWIENAGVFFAGPVPAAAAGDSSLSQSVTIPVTMTAPTLSFLYQLKSASEAGGTAFSVSINDSITTTILLSTTTNVADWTHAWFDLTPWVSQTITLTFNLHEAAGYPYAWAFLDEITLGSAYPDVWVSASSDQPAVLPGDSLFYALTYSNRGGAEAISTTITATLPAGLIFESASITPTLIGDTLVWTVGDLPAGSGPYTILITATVSPSATLGSYLISTLNISTASPELETANNQFEATIFVGRLVYLPTVWKE